MGGAIITPISRVRKLRFEEAVEFPSALRPRGVPRPDAAVKRWPLCWSGQPLGERASAWQPPVRSCPEASPPYSSLSLSLAALAEASWAGRRPPSCPVGTLRVVTRPRTWKMARPFSMPGRKSVILRTTFLLVYKMRITLVAEQLVLAGGLR